MTSLFDLYKIGVGPSSSHTMGPMRAACLLREVWKHEGSLVRVESVRVELYGSLALTGMGHGTDRAVLLGLSGNEPAAIDPAAIETTVAAIRSKGRLELAGKRSIEFNEARDLVFRPCDDVSAGSANAASERTEDQGLRRHRTATGGEHVLLDRRRIHRRGWRGGEAVRPAASGASVSVS